MRDGEALGDGGCVHVLSAHDAEVYSAAWHPIHESLLATGGYNGSLIYWEVGMESEPVLQAAVPAAHENAIWTMDWHPNGHLLCTGSNDHTAKFWATGATRHGSGRSVQGLSARSIRAGLSAQVERIDPDDDDSDANEANAENCTSYMDVDEISKAAGAIPGISVPKEKAAGSAASIAIALEPPRPS